MSCKVKAHSQDIAGKVRFPPLHIVAIVSLSGMETSMVMCPTCGEYFEVVPPSFDELPTEWDYDCEICCRPMVILFDEGGAYAKGLGE